MDRATVPGFIPDFKEIPKNGIQFKGKIVKCAGCGKDVYRRMSLIKRSKFIACSKSCASKVHNKGKKPWNKGKELHYDVWNKGKDNPDMAMEKHPGWKGGRTNASGGYITVREKTNMTKLEHRLVMEKHIGRKLTSKEVVHHIDEDRKNNHISNLMLFASNSEHIKHHAKLRRDEKLKQNSYMGS